VRENVTEKMGKCVYLQLHGFYRKTKEKGFARSKKRIYVTASGSPLVLFLASLLG
jgi:hypothetical protein